MEKTAQDYKQQLTDIIKKQIVLLGPDITMAQVKKVLGITVSDDGTVTDIQGEPKMVMHSLVETFVEFSGEIVKKTMESLFNQEPAVVLPAVPTQPAPIQPTPSSMPQIEPAPMQLTPQPMPSTPVSNRPMMKVEEVPTAPSLSMPSVTPPPTPMTPMPTPQPTVAPMPAATAPQAGQAPQAQNDPDMQHIINEALKQTQ